MSRTINQKMRRFAECYLTADSKAHAARLAGYPEDRARITAQRLLNHPGVQAVIKEERAKLSEQWGIKRNQLVAMLLLAYDRAESAQEMVSACRELAKLLGLYAPQKKEQTVVSTQIVKRLEQMSDEELMQIITKPEPSATIL